MVVVTDNAANVTAAVRLCGWKHVPCYAHSLNLIVQAALKEIEQVHIKVKTIVTYFKRSPQDVTKLKEIQRQMGTTEINLKLLLGGIVPTMFCRILQVKEP